MSAIDTKRAFVVRSFLTEYHIGEPDAAGLRSFESTGFYPSNFPSTRCRLVGFGFYSRNQEGMQIVETLPEDEDPCGYLLILQTPEGRQWNCGQISLVN